MNRYEELRIDWLLRKLCAPRVDPGQSRLWAITLAALMVVALTGTLALLLLAKVQRLVPIAVFVADGVDAHNRGVTRDRTVMAILGGVGMLASLTMAGLYWRLARRYGRSAPQADRSLRAHALRRCWMALLGALAVALVVAVFFRFGPQYLSP